MHAPRLGGLQQEPVLEPLLEPCQRGSKTNSSRITYLLTQIRGKSRGTQHYWYWAEAPFPAVSRFRLPILLAAVASRAWAEQEGGRKKGRARAEEVSRPDLDTPMAESPALPLLRSSHTEGMSRCPPYPLFFICMGCCLDALRCDLRVYGLQSCCSFLQYLVRAPSA
jgi:hypothetical protein